jgi:hypothetical protein
LQNAPTSTPALASAANRAVTVPEKLVFVPGWNEAIAAFSFENMSLRKQQIKVAESDVRVLSIEAKGEEMFGPHYIAFTVQIPTAGSYEISLDALRGPVQGTVQLMFNNVLVGNATSFNAPSLTKAEAVNLGTVPLKAGENQLFFQLANEAGKADPFHVDMIRIACTRK